MRMFICCLLPAEYVKAYRLSDGRYLVVSFDELDGDEVFCPPGAFLELVHSKPYYMEESDD